jgi:hypothetical protein
MEVFQTIISGCQIIYKFLDSYSSASSRSKPLAARLKWDLRVLQQFTDYYETRDTSSLLPEDAETLEHSKAYLVGLSTKVSSIAGRLQSKSKFRKVLNKALWWHREDKVRRLEGELFEWTTRLGIWLEGLPTELKTVIKLENNPNSPTPKFAASVQIHSLWGMAEKAKQVLNDSMFRTEVDDCIKNASADDDQRFGVVEDQDSQLIIERRFHNLPRGSKAWLELKDTFMCLADAAIRFQGTTVSLMRYKYFFHDT